ncbi:GH1 family beta-glucosidase [Mucilaginibacter sp. dw_454]|uniref:GH1 family beta-glucosidase n=1 Tax=Mucilaginibacter sp. dw_454 TaxID=2720079 RepID=UPI001BD25B77|nr:GH1 family beta-glucosidase [Mucilaginibacter sp. dw_454]
MESNTQNTPLSKQLFGEDFIWGVSTAAVQIEGAFDVDGKGESIWDVFATKKGKILHGHHHYTATDFYNRYQTDIDLIKQLNIPNFRFSIAWSRILPDGTGKVNQAGINYYRKVIQYCLDNGIEPWITLYHWDIPHVLEAKGGWTNRDVVDWFSEYVAVCADAFGDLVKHWMVMNEPAVFTGAGYFLGIHAPGRKGIRNFLPAIHHAVLCMAEGGRILRKMLPKVEIGTTFSCSYVEPYSNKPKDVAAALRVDTLLNRMYIEPILGLGYPADDLPVLKGMEKHILPGDMEKVKFDFDFIGIQNYTREIVKHSFFTPYIHASLVKAERRNVPITAMKWEVYPESIYHILKKYDQYPQIKKIYLTESGAAFKDEVVENRVNDPKRTEYLQQFLQQVLKAKNEGSKVNGYFIWTLTDNFEWAEGYNPRFGIIYVNFETQERIVKASGLWYANLLR